MTLKDLKPDASCRIVSLLCADDIKRRLLDLGFTPGTKITYVLKSPSGDPTSFFVRGTHIALRESECRNIIICDAKEGKND